MLHCFIYINCVSNNEKSCLLRLSIFERSNYRNKAEIIKFLQNVSLKWFLN
jgi:hypothetical protein